MFRDPIFGYHIKVFFYRGEGAVQEHSFIIFNTHIQIFRCDSDLEAIWHCTYPNVLAGVQITDGWMLPDGILFELNTCLTHAWSDLLSILCTTFIKRKSSKVSDNWKWHILNSSVSASAQYSWNALRIHRNPDLNKGLTEDE